MDETDRSGVSRPVATAAGVGSAPWVSRGAVAVGLLLVTAFFWLPSGGPAQTSLFVLAALAAPTLLAVRLARERLLGTRPWLLLVAGAGLYGAATPFWGLVPVLTGRQLPFPSPLDGVYFASYVLASAFLVTLILRRQRHGKEARRGATVALLDAGIFAVAMAAVLWPSLIGPALADPEVAGLPQAIALAYPLLTAVMVGLVVRVAISAARWTPELTLLLVWAGGELLGDVFYGYLSATGAFTYGHPISVTWLVSYVALGALAAHPGLPRLTEGDDQLALHGSRLWLPLGAVLLPLTISLFAPSPLLHVVSIVGVLLLVARLRLLSGDLAEQRRLAADLAVLSARFEHQALHDGLTGLANRSLFDVQLEQAWAGHQRHGRGLVALVLDRDGFKAVNDRYGHHAGDELLVETARRLRRCVRDGDTLARLGGDEFALVLTDADLRDAHEVADRIQHTLSGPVGDGPDAPTVAASIGIAAATLRHRGADQLMREADVAMFAAKSAGKGRHVTYGAAHASGAGAPGDRSAQTSSNHELHASGSWARLPASLPSHVARTR